MKKSTALIIISVITAVILSIIAVLLMQVQIKEAEKFQNNSRPSLESKP